MSTLRATPSRIVSCVLVDYLRRLITVNVGDTANGTARQLVARAAGKLFLPRRIVRRENTCLRSERKEFPHLVERSLVSSRDAKIRK